MKVSGSGAWASLLGLLVLVPTLTIALSGRDVNQLDFARDVSPDSVVALIGRVTVLLVALLAAATLVNSGRGLALPTVSRRRAGLLLAAVILFILGHAVLPSLFGREYPDGFNILYGPLLLVVAYRAGRMSSSGAIGMVRFSLVLVMLAGLLAMVVVPDLAVQTYQAPVRLPFIEFRFWGLGSNPNNIAPLALVLVFLLIYQPFKSLTANVFALVVAGLTILFAQSQTTWTAALIVLPLYGFYRLIPKPIRSARVDPYALVSMIVLSTVGLILLVWEVAQVDFSFMTDTAVELQKGCRMHSVRTISSCSRSVSVAWSGWSRCSSIYLCWAICLCAPRKTPMA